MYKLNQDNFFYLNSRIATSGFWFVAYINNISNLQWLQLRFYTFNKYDISFFLFKTRILNKFYLNMSFHNRSVALFSKYYKYFFNSKIEEDNFFLVEADYEKINIKCYAFFYLNYIISLGTFFYYKKYNLLNFVDPLIGKFSYPYIFYMNSISSFYKILYYYFYSKILLWLLIYNFTFSKCLNVYY